MKSNVGIDGCSRNRHRSAQGNPALGHRPALGGVITASVCAFYRCQFLVSGIFISDNQPQYRVKTNDSALRSWLPRRPTCAACRVAFKIVRPVVMVRLQVNSFESQACAESHANRKSAGSNPVNFCVYGARSIHRDNNAPTGCGTAGSSKAIDIDSHGKRRR